MSSGQSKPTSGQLEGEAIDALEEGNYSKLARLAEGLSGTQDTTSFDVGSDNKLVTGASEPPDYCFVQS